MSHRPGELRTADKREVRRRLWRHQRGRCYWCGRNTVLPERGRTAPEPGHATIDHVTPLCECRHDRNRNGYANVVMCCFACNDRRNRETQGGLRCRA